MQTRSIRFEYYRLHCTKIEDNSTFFPVVDITSLLEVALTKSPADRTYRFRGEEARLQQLKKIKLSGRDCWEIQFLRIRDGVLPGIAKIDGTFEIMDLEPDEFIGEEIAAIYDSATSVLAVQRNRNSLSPSGIEMYLNHCLPDNGFRLHPIRRGSAPEFKKQDIFRGITISIDGSMEDLGEEKTGSSLLQALKRTAPLSGGHISVSVTVGPHAKKQQSLDSDELLHTIEESQKLTGIKTFRVGKRNDEDTRVEWYDLLDFSIYDYARMDFDRENKINYERVILDLRKLLLARINEIEKILKPEA